MMGALAALVFSRATNMPSGMSFGMVPPSPLPPQDEAVRSAATDNAFAIIAYVTAGLAAVSAILAWTTQRHKAKAS
jgi:hypothetical protein